MKGICIDMMDKPQLFMRLKTLENLPETTLDEGFSCRHFLPGDETTWEHITKTVGFDMNFNESIKSEPFFVPERVWFVCHNDKPIATATAWVYKDEPEKTGYVHMVAALPEYSGRKLGYNISLAVLHQMKKFNLNQAVLHTDDFRLAAVKIYLSLGFEPEFDKNDDSMALRWREVLIGLQKQKQIV